MSGVRKCMDCSARLIDRHKLTKRCDQCRRLRAKFLREQDDREPLPKRERELRHGLPPMNPAADAFRPRQRKCGKCGQGFITTRLRRYFCGDCYAVSWDVAPGGYF